MKNNTQAHQTSACVLFIVLRQKGLHLKQVKPFSLKNKKVNKTVYLYKNIIIKYTLNIDITGNIWYNNLCKKDIKVHRHQNIRKISWCPATEYWKYSVALWLIYSVL